MSAFSSFKKINFRFVAADVKREIPVKAKILRTMYNFGFAIVALQIMMNLHCKNISMR